MSRKQRPAGSHKSTVLAQVPEACRDERAAVEFLEEQRWGEHPECPRCKSEKVYRMAGADGQRNARFLWRCHGCKKQYTVRIGTVYEDSRIPLRHWCYAFWRASASKKGISALQVSRETGLSYGSALFMMHRIRFAMTERPENAPKLLWTVESDECYVGGKILPGEVPGKTAVMAMVERGGEARASHIGHVYAENLKNALTANVDPLARIMTDEHPAYPGATKRFVGGHFTVKHSAREYARGEVSSNTAESFFAILKRAVYGTWHSVSHKHLHRYVGEVEYRWNTRKVDDGQRLSLAIRRASGKRLTYRELVRKPA